MPSLDHLRRLTIVVSILILVTTAAFSQKGGNPSGAQNASQGNTGTPSGQGGGQGLQGFSFAPEEWPELTLPDVQRFIWPYRGRSVLCYKLTKSNSASQPFILQRIHLPNEVAGSGFDRPCGDHGKGEPDAEGKKWCVKNHQPDNHWNICSQLDEDHPMIMGQELVVGIDISDLHEAGINTNQVKLLNINVTSQQSTPLNPSPIRPSFPGAAGGGASGSTGSGGEASETSLGGGWWTPLRIRPPGWHGQVWHANTRYERGDVVADASLTRFFRANKKCFNSGPDLNDPFPRQQSADWVRDGSVIWQEMYVDPKKKAPAEAEPWQPNHPYDARKIVSVARGGSALQATCTATRNHEEKRVDYYWAVRGGTSGAKPKDPFSIVLLPRAIYVSWPFQLPGDVIPSVSVNIVYSPPSPGAPWQGNTFYPTGSVVTSSANNGHYYTALVGGFSGSEPHEPEFPANAPPTTTDGDLVWLDSGFTAPSVASASQSGAQGSGGSKPQLWLANTRYLVGDVLQNPKNGHYYTMIRSTGGRSGNTPKDPFPTLPAAIITVHDGDLLWQRTDQPATKGEWKANQDYQKNDIVTIDGSTFRLIASIAIQGKSSNSDFSQAADPGKTFSDGDIVWQDLGPASEKTQSREKNKVYVFGQQVSTTNGELYVMVGRNGGNSGPTKPNLPNAPGKPTTVVDGDLIWISTGNTCSDPSWFPNQSYALTATVCSGDKHEYRLLRYTAGSSGPSEPAFLIFEPKTVVDASALTGTNGAWQDSGVVRPVGTPKGDVSWIQFQSDDKPTPYKSGDVVYMEKPSPGHYYKCISKSCTGDIPGSSSVTAQDFAVISYPPLTWQDVGTTPPSSVSSSQPADQTVSLLNAALPQVHSLSYFNIAAGAVVTFKRPPTFGFATAPNIPSSVKLPNGFGPAPAPIVVSNGSPALNIEPTTGCTVTLDKTKANPDGTQPVYACPVKTGSGSFQFDPVLALTVYIPPIDAEVPFRWNRWGSWRPAPSGGFSLANPTSNFFLGASNEFPVRNVQVFYGLSLVKTQLEILGANQTIFSGVGPAPAVVTKQGFQKGFFTGLTFNLSNFIQSLGFGGSKGGQ